MDHGGHASRPSAVARRGAGHLRLARGRALADPALAHGTARGSRCRRGDRLRRDERHLLPAVHRRARRPAPLRDELGRRRMEAVAFLAALDPLVWDREFLRILFDFEYTWEVYVPAPKR